MIRVKVEINWILSMIKIKFLAILLSTNIYLKELQLTDIKT